VVTKWAYFEFLSSKLSHILMQGLDIYDSKEVRDKQIARIIGKVQFFDSFHPSVSLHASNSDYSVPLLYCNIIFYYRLQQLLLQFILEWQEGHLCFHPTNYLTLRTSYTCLILCMSYGTFMSN
jgi:hypothetical protein